MGGIQQLSASWLSSSHCHGAWGVWSTGCLPGPACVCKGECARDLDHNCCLGTSWLWGGGQMPLAGGGH